MKYEKPAVGICKHSFELPDYETFHIECDCTASEHAVEMVCEIDSDSKFKDINVTFYVTTYTPLSNFLERLKISFNVLFFGCNKEEHSILLKPQAALNWMTAMKQSIEKLSKDK